MLKMMPNVCSMLLVLKRASPSELFRERLASTRRVTRVTRELEPVRRWMSLLFISLREDCRGGVGRGRSQGEGWGGGGVKGRGGKGEESRGGVSKGEKSRGG